MGSSYDRPMAFNGTNEEREINNATHTFIGGEELRCADCDCRYGSNIMDWPCGDAMREVLEDGVVVRTYSEGE